MENRNKLLMGVILDNSTYKKIREFSIINKFSINEIIRTLLEKTEIHIDTRNIKTIISDAKEKGKINKQQVQITLTEKLQVKIRKMALANDASFSEIIRCLIQNADFSKMTFRTQSEIKAANAKANKKK
jgi:16S rRNA U516 pseudouridylate synthase RsuA-like enzyme